jgi:hypothetical protein
MNFHLSRRLLRTLSLGVLSLSASAFADNQTVTGNLFVNGVLEVDGNTTSFGSSGVNPGYSLIYTDGSPATIDFSATAAAANWVWSDDTNKPQLKLSSLNTLSLFPVGSPDTGIVLNPSGPSYFITSNGSGQTTDFLRLLSAGTNAPGTTQRIAGYTDVLSGYIDFKRFTDYG